MENVDTGLYVQIDYTGKLEDGEVFDSSVGRQPLEVQVGTGQLIAGFERELMGMAVDDQKTFTLSPEEAYGERDDSRTHSFGRSELPAEANPQVGQILGLHTKEGHHIPARILVADDEKVVLDLNHPLAGHALTFDIKVVGITAAPTQKAHGCGCGCGPDESDGAHGGGCGSGCGSGCGC
jgi:peptidylprolyl isomerase